MSRRTLTVAALLLGAVVVAIPALAGSTNTYIEPPNLAIKVESDLFKGKPAVVVLHFVASNGYRVKSVLGYRIKPAFYLRTCEGELPGKIPALVLAAKRTREGALAPTDRPPFSYKGLKFVGAECISPPQNLSDLDEPRTAVEFSFLPSSK